MRIVVHDYAGHPFQIQLSRTLAFRGHEVHHLYFADDITPRGALTPRPSDPSTLMVRGLSLGRRFEKFRYWRRVLDERQYGRTVARYLREIAADVVVCANVPVDALAQIRRLGLSSGTAFVIWLQDLLSVGIRTMLRKRLGPVGGLLGRRFVAVERRNLRRADRIVAITEDFRLMLDRFGIDRSRWTVIENWAPLDELAPCPAPHRWPREQGLDGRRLVLYSGTLGLKHNPRLLAELAAALAAHPDLHDVAVVVLSESQGVSCLRQEKAERRLDNLILLPWQPYERLAEIYSAATILLATIEADAGAFAVPSKVLSYLCVGRPIVLASPSENLAARSVERAGAGAVVGPDDARAFAEAVIGLLRSPAAAAECARRARRYAEQHFDIERIADRFEAVLAAARRYRHLERSLPRPVAQTN